MRAQSAGGIGGGGGAAAHPRHQRVTGPSFSSGVAEIYSRQQQQQQQRKDELLLCSHHPRSSLLSVLTPPPSTPSLPRWCALFSTALSLPHHRCDGLLVLSPSLSLSPHTIHDSLFEGAAHLHPVPCVAPLTIIITVVHRIISLASYCRLPLSSSVPSFFVHFCIAITYDCD